MTQSTLMTDAPATNSDSAATTQATAKADATVTDTAKNQPPAPAAESGTSTGNSTESDQVEQTPVGAPEKYEFKAPEGRNFDNEVIKEYSDVARELNLSQESAQRVLDRVGPKMAERQSAMMDTIKQGWIDSSRQDKEFGGESIERHLSTAKKALDAFGSPELKTLLKDSGLGNHPELIRFFFRAGKSMSEDTFVGASNGASPHKGQPHDFASQAAAMYSNNS